MLTVVEAFHSGYWVWALMRYISECTGVSCRRADDVLSADYLLRDAKPEAVIIDLFGAWDRMTDVELAVSQPEDYVGYNWAKKVLAQRPEMQGRIIIYSRFVSSSLLEVGLKRVFPGDDLTAFHLIEMNLRDGFEPIQQVLDEIARMPAISR